MGNIWLLLLGLLITLSGVVMIYDARPITTHFFSFGDQNEASLGLKMLGFMISMIGSMMVYFNI